MREATGSEEAAFLIFFYRTTSAGWQAWGEAERIFREWVDVLTLAKGRRESVGSG
jgi:hypothetical protein